MRRRGFSGRPSRVYDPLFASAWLKWAQGVLHAQTLQADIERIGHKPDAYPVLAFRSEYHPNRHGFAVIAEEIAPIPVRWPLLLGDIANNYRAALDHLAWALVSRGRTPPAKLTKRQENAVYFPIHKERTEFNGKVGSQLPGVRRADLAKVRRYQPYHHGQSVRPRHALPLLAGINAGDKHRSIQPLWAVSVETKMKITQRRDCVITGTKPGGIATALEADAEIAFLHARRTGLDPKIEMELEITAEPTLDNILGVREWAQAICVEIMSLLFEFSPQPKAAVREVGAKLRDVGVDALTVPDAA
ncbi:MAG TPA: hypothetical protein VFY48_08050 [Solirubrobacterales bacterium]|nr:hypothetical protein [Solirubrobacterales bacterium]